jgi:transcriptional antiterminator RfaH
VETVLTPLFPRYLFVSLDIERERWRVINGTVGVVHLVCHGDRPAPVPAGVVEEIRAREDESGAVVLAVPSFRRGAALRITHGPLAEQTGLFEQMADQERVVLLLNLLGRDIRVTVPREAVAADS